MLMRFLEDREAPLGGGDARQETEVPVGRAATRVPWLDERRRRRAPRAGLGSLVHVPRALHRTPAAGPFRDDDEARVKALLLNPRSLWGLVRKSVAGFSADNASSMGPALALYSLLSMAPL